MIKFLETEEISACLKRIIHNANETLFLVSPYLKIRPKLRSYLEAAINKKVKVVIVYRHRNFDFEDEEWLDNYSDKIQMIENKNLHAKCYLNENQAIVISMNIHRTTTMKWAY